jgi:hypothetical protein
MKLKKRMVERLAKTKLAAGGLAYPDALVEATTGAGEAQYLHAHAPCVFCSSLE